MESRLELEQRLKEAEEALQELEKGLSSLERSTESEEQMRGNVTQLRSECPHARASAPRNITTIWSCYVSECKNTTSYYLEYRILKFVAVKRAQLTPVSGHTLPPVDRACNCPSALERFDFKGKNINVPAGYR